MYPLLRRTGDFPEVFPDTDPAAPLEIAFTRHAAGVPEHLRIRWRWMPDAEPTSRRARGNGKAA